ncbi:ABC transporter permease [Paludisphaera mucosa]|uniref:ABC transporter permease n=1 Tax=Paludisphaera mucosa TaxID=3030827 RepID=A0ABT6F846_9BACT|nr:ABC transporter permease [Paludisphaera mucosa]MDG3003656.1 ABC transporter permease [Paludisphaera mucosa]
MSLDLRKIRIVAATEFSSSVRTKSFIISLLALPLIMGGSILLQVFVGKQVDVKPRRFVLVDPSGAFAPTITKAVEAYNAHIEASGGKIAMPRFVMEPTPPAPASGGEAARSLELSDRVRRGELDAYIEIAPGGAGPDASPTIQYHSNNPNDDILRGWVSQTVDAEVRARRFRTAGIDQALAERLGRPVQTENLQLAEANDAGGARKVDPIRSMVVPAVLLFLVFMIVMTSGPQLLNSVIEEKMSRISEVLLGSVSPFDLMLGKLIGNVGVAMLLASLYLGAGYGVAAYHGYGDVISPALLGALVLFLFLAVLLFGSLYMAVGAACNDLKDAQSLMWPVMILSMLPVFVWTSVLKNPASTLSVGMSLFPPATPFLMLMRMAMQPSPPVWQVVLSVALTTATAVACVWAGARIFRTGLLMQGKTPSLAEMAKWAMKG